MDLLILATWVLLGLVGYFSGGALIERVLYHGFRRLADPLALGRLLRRWQRCRRVVAGERRPLGWLGGLLRGAGGNAELLAGLCHAELRQALRYQNFLPMAANVATALGLLGAVVALAGSNQAANPRAVF